MSNQPFWNWDKNLNLVVIIILRKDRNGRIKNIKRASLPHSHHVDKEVPKTQLWVVELSVAVFDHDQTHWKSIMKPTLCDKITKSKQRLLLRFTKIFYKNSKFIPVPDISETCYLRLLLVKFKLSDLIQLFWQIWQNISIHTSTIYNLKQINKWDSDGSLSHPWTMIQRLLRDFQTPWF